MRIRNTTRNTVVAEDASVADTYFSRLRGLLGEKKLPQGNALVITPCNSIHTFFMQFPIDALFLDKEHKVVKMLEKVVPFRVSGIYFKADIVIELPQGAVARSLTHLADTISFE